jgi:hypothetical protein
MNTVPGRLRRPSAVARCRRWLLAALVILPLAACSSISGRIGERLGNDLAAGLRNHDDPATVAEALPAYLLLLDGMLEGDPKNVALLRSAAELYGAYSGSFVADPARARRLSARSLDYARRAACIELPALCAALDGPVDSFVALTATLSRSNLPLAHALASGWAGYIQAHSEDWAAIAALPKAQALLERVVALEPAYLGGMPHAYLGVLHSLRPAAVGGQPERARAAFEQAIALSDGANLMAKTLFAEFHARAVFDRELHDRLLAEVLAADPQAPGFTLSNILARQRAAALRDSADQFF